MLYEGTEAPTSKGPFESMQLRSLVRRYSTKVQSKQGEQSYLISFGDDIM